MKEGLRVSVPGKLDMLFKELVSEYLKKIGENGEGKKFLFNSEELYMHSTKTLSEHCLKDGSVIDVIQLRNINSFENVETVEFVINGNEIFIQAIKTEPFEEVIENFKNITGLQREGKYLRFFYKNKEIFAESGKTVDDFHIDDKILCVNCKKNDNSEIIKLKDELKRSKDVINNLQNKLQKANKTIDLLNQKNILIQKKINDLKNNCNNYNQIQNLNNIIANKQKEIEELKKENNKIKNPYVRFEDIRMLQFMTGDGIINNYPIKCLISETFAEVEERLYQTFPEFRETNNTFISNGNVIKRFKKISENNIKEGSPIQLIVPV